MSTSETLQARVRSIEGFWSTNVPVEITASVMSLLPVPDLCTCRSVCKTWNELLRQPQFLTDGRRDHAYLFVTAHLSNGESSWVDPAYRRTTCFFDLNKRRWFRVPVDATVLNPTDDNAGDNVPLLLAMDDGLICELSVNFCRSSPIPNKEIHRLVMRDPVAKTMRELPAITGFKDGPVFRLAHDAPPAIVTVVDHANRNSFKVFLLSSRAIGPHTGFFLYESSTDAWRDLGNPVARVRVAEMIPPPEFAETLVYFRGNLYATFYILASRTVLLRYNLQENSWKEVLGVESTKPGYPELVVTGDRMFMAIWLDAQSPHGQPLSHESEGIDYAQRPVFEIKEIVVKDEIGAEIECSSKTVVRIPYVDLKRMFYGTLPVRNEFGLQYDVAVGFPVDCDSVVLMSRQTGKLITYNVASGCVGALPAHPLRQGSLELAMKEVLPVTFRAKHMSLSLRNVLTA